MREESHAGAYPIRSRSPILGLPSTRPERLATCAGRSRTVHARTYATYNTKPLYQNARYVSVNSSSVHGGGIVRAVVHAAEEGGSRRSARRGGARPLGPPRVD